VLPNVTRFIMAIRDGAQVLPDFARGASLQQVLDLAARSDAQGCTDQAV